jgi:hypothetical protein
MAFQHQISGFGSVIADVDGSTFRALKTRNAPIEYGNAGHFQAALKTGSIAAGAQTDQEILQMRWVDGTRLFVPLKITLDGVIATTAFAAGALDAHVTIARSWSADGTLGTVPVLTGNNNKLRTSMASSLFSTGFRVSTTAVLGAGTKTFDANRLGQYTWHTAAYGTNAAPAPQIGSYIGAPAVLFEQDMADGEHPIVCAQNEGIAVRITCPATGVHIWGLTVKWAEVQAF